MKKWALIGCLLFACINVHAQSAWKKFPEKAKVERKKLRNTCTSFLYNDELQIEHAEVVNNRMLQLRLRCTLHSLEYRSEVKVQKRSLYNGRYVEFTTYKPEEPLFFLPDETIEVGLDLSSFNQNGEYIFTFKLHKELEEAYYVDVLLHTEEVPEPTGFELITRNLDYEKLREDENHVYTWIDRHTDFPGGNEGLVRFIKENVRYENLPTDLKWYESVTIGMIIEKDGSILYPDVISSDNRGWDAEALRLVNAMPQWKPGTIGGVKVRQRAYVRFNFGKLERSCILFDDYYYD